jgi:hypothetical protein
MPEDHYCAPRNRIGWRERLARLEGVPIEFDLRSFDQELSRIHRLGFAARYGATRRLWKSTGSA